MRLKEVLKNPACLEIVKFFHENPSAIDTPRGIATWVSMDLDVAREALEKLTKINILTRHKAYQAAAYGYTNNKRIVAQVAEILKNNGR